MPRSHASVKIINQNENDWFLMTNDGLHDLQNGRTILS